MKFFVDENIPNVCVQFLSLAGHSTFDIRGTDSEGTDDQSIFKMAQEKETVFITTDKDFFHTIPHLYKNHFGVVVINLRQPNKFNMLEKITWALSNIDFTDFESKVLLLRDNNYTLLNKD